MREGFKGLQSYDIFLDCTIGNSKLEAIPYRKGKTSIWETASCK